MCFRIVPKGCNKCFFRFFVAISSIWRGNNTEEANNVRTTTATTKRAQKLCFRQMRSERLIVEPFHRRNGIPQFSYLKQCKIYYYIYHTTHMFFIKHWPVPSFSITQKRNVNVKKAFCSFWWRLSKLVIDINGSLCI